MQTLSKPAQMWFITRKSKTYSLCLMKNRNQNKLYLNATKSRCSFNYSYYMVHLTKFSGKYINE